MSIEQIRWARCHDWFLYENGNGSVTCLEVSVWPDGSVTEKIVVFSNYRKLRQWAGY